MNEFQDDFCRTNFRMTADERREHILRAAMRMFSDNGFRGTTTKRIAEEANVSEALIFKFFSSKEELFSAIIQYKVKTATDPLGDLSFDSGEVDDFTIFFKIALDALQRQRENVEFSRLLFYSALEGHELTRVFFRCFVSQFYDRLSSYIRKRQQEGVFREIDPMIVVRAFLGMIIHHSMISTLWDPENSILDIDDEVAAGEFANLLLDGIRK